ncbi:MAG: YegP family protein [Flavobacteriaceae bacterium]
MRKAYYNTFIGKDGQFYFNLTASNSEIILQSEGYKTRSSSLNGIKSVQENCTNDSNYERKVAINNEYYFVLKAKNGEPIGKSETYSSKQAMEKGITSVKKNGTTTNINDSKNTFHVIFVNKSKYKVAEDCLTGNEILALSEFTSQEYSLYLIKGNSKNEIQPEEKVHLKNGMHFHAILKDIKFG